jgi:branched-chain amino acid transport system substrate-binding protein
MKKGLAVMLVLFLMALSLTACGGQSQTASTQETNNGTSGEQAGGGDKAKEETGESEPAKSGGEKVVNIGWTGPLSGGAVLYGKRTLNGINMAIEEINEKGGIEVNGEKYKLNLVSLDDRYLPNEAATNAKRLVQENKTPVVFTPHSGGVLAIQQFNQEMGFVLAAYTSEPKILLQGNKMQLMMPPNYDLYLKPFSQVEMERFGKRLGLVPGTHAYAKDWTEVFTKAWKDEGGEVLSDNAVDYNKDTDFYTPVTKALAEKPDVLFVGGASEPTALVIKQAKELGFKGGFVVMDQAKLDEMAPIVGGMDKLEGAVGVTPLVNYPWKGTQPFVERYKKIYNEDPGSEAGLNYMGLYVVAKAMELAGSVTDAQAISAKFDEAAKALPPDQMPYPLTGVDDKGHFVSDVVASIVTDGKLEPVPIPRAQ